MPHYLDTRPDAMPDDQLDGLEHFWATSGLGNLRPTCERAAMSRAPILLQGETGSGKSTLARWLHSASPRKDHPYALRGCGTFHDQAFVATLFGYEKGAYTGADRADKGLLRGCDGGTLILDDINTLPMSTQARLLQFLDSGSVTPLGAPNQVHPVNVRIIATSNEDLRTCVKEHRFRADLYYRISTILIQLPPLAHRNVDFRNLVSICEKMAAAHFPDDANLRPLSKGAIDLLAHLDWPGNYRELQNTITQIKLHASPHSSLPINTKEMVSLFLEHYLAPEQLSILREKYQQDDQKMLTIMKILSGNVALTAKLLLVSRQTVYDKMARYGWQKSPGI